MVAPVLIMLVLPKLMNTMDKDTQKVCKCCGLNNKRLLNG